jgi:hypothetical protein
VILHRLRKLITVFKNHFDFIPGRSIIKAIFLIRQLIERYRELKKDLYMIFTNLEKAYDKILRNINWWALEKKWVQQSTLSLLRICTQILWLIRACDGESDVFSIKIRLYQGSELSLYIFILVMNDNTNDIQGKNPWCMLFADDVVLIDDSMIEVDQKLELLR